MRRIGRQRIGNLQYLNEQQVVVIRRNAAGVGGFQKRWRALVSHLDSQLEAEAVESTLPKPSKESSLELEFEKSQSQAART